LTDNYFDLAAQDIFERYSNSVYNLDYRLRIGEVLLNTIRRSGTAFGKYGNDFGIYSIF
jgi:hypothetical protein